MKMKSQKREGNKYFFEVEEDYSSFQAALEKATVKVGREIKVPGFRPGKAPRGLIEKAVNPEYVANHAAEDLIGENYPKLIEEAKIEPVDYPKLEVVQLEKDRPFIYKVTVEVYPEVKLGRYKGLKVEKKSADTDGDVKNKLIAAASEEARVEIPSAMVEREINIMLDELKTSLAQSGLTLEDYLKGAKREEKEIREEMKKSAEIRVKGKVVLRAVGEAEKLTVTPEEIEVEIKQFAGKMDESVKKYVAEHLLRKKALDFLVEKANIKPLDTSTSLGARGKEEKKNEA